MISVNVGANDDYLCAFEVTLIWGKVECYWPLIKPGRWFVARSFRWLRHAGTTSNGELFLFDSCIH